jgi:hypothetical protein
MDELKKYYTGDELGGHRADQGMDREAAGSTGQGAKE